MKHTNYSAAPIREAFPVQHKRLVPLAGRLTTRSAHAKELLEIQQTVRKHLAESKSLRNRIAIAMYLQVPRLVAGAIRHSGKKQFVRGGLLRLAGRICLRPYMRQLDRDTAQAIANSRNRRALEEN